MLRLRWVLLKNPSCLMHRLYIVIVHSLVALGVCVLLCFINPHVANPRTKSCLVDPQKSQFWCREDSFLKKFNTEMVRGSDRETAVKELYPDSAN